MAEHLTEPKGHLALDIGWRTAAAAIIGFVFCVLGAVVLAWKVTTVAPVEVRVTWQNVIVVLFGIWLTIEVRGRTTRFVLGLLLLASGSRLILAALHASIQTQILNGEIMRVVDLVVVAGFCCYIPYWFRRRIKRA
jgi:hypothetical protein